MSKITKEKKVKLEKELEDLKQNKRKEIVERLRHARDLGDLSENAEYDEARRDQAILESLISEIEDILLNSEIVEKVKSHEVVVFGTNLELKKEDEDKSKIFRIVSKNETMDGNIIGISEESPMGKAIVGKKVGDTISVENPKGISRYKIIKIS